MDKINPTILKTTIKAIPALTEEKFYSWRTWITTLFKPGVIKDNMINGKPALDDNNNTILCAIILAKLSATTHTRVYNFFASIDFDPSNIKKFITEVRSALVKMEDVGIKMVPNICTYDFLKILTSSLKNIKPSITHSRHRGEIMPKTLLDHLEIHINEIKVSNKSKIESVSTTMFTEEESHCQNGFHNPKANQPKHRCWFL
ncbi:hypothetical protein VP01_4440g2 [Puccinia sorghi]|uniref:Uncharacterized protein n=1 Tax=Puccinia sorghi TaxID=27349 RepID=A0A0L6UPF6_9BASI|nr:hypothetical protein VP01_4440g2 [Puccinia sorghi]